MHHLQPKNIGGAKKNFSRRLRRRETPYFTLNFDFYCIFERQFFVKSAKFSFKPRKILGFDKKIDTKTTIFKKKIFVAQKWQKLVFIAFLSSNFSKICQIFLKTAPSAPNFGRFAPKILPPPTPKSMGGQTY